MATPTELLALRGVLVAALTACLLLLRDAAAHVSPYGCGGLFDRYSVPQFLLIVALSAVVSALVMAIVAAQRPQVRGASVRLLLASGGVAAGLLLGETALRAAAVADVVTDPLPSVEELIYENHPLMGSWLKSNFTFSLGGLRFTTDHEGVIVRRPEGNFSVPGGARKVMLLGSSLVEGYQVPAELNFSLHLERALSARGGRPYHVLNLGKGGFSPIKYLLVHRHFQPRYDPDLVVAFLYAFNDALNDSRIDRDGRITRDASGEIVRVWPEVDLWKREVWTAWGGAVPLNVREDQTTWLARTKTHALLRKQVLRFCDAAFGATMHAAAPAVDPPAPERRMFPPQVPVREAPFAMFKTHFTAEDLADIGRTESYVDKLNQEVASTGAQLILVMIPDKIQVSTVQPGVKAVVSEPRPQDRFRAFAERRGIPFIDLLPLLQRRGNEVLYLEDSHFNVRGHAVVGAALAEALLAQGLPK